MDKKNTRIKNLRTVASLALVGLYVIGLIAMMTFSFQVGLILWVVSTLGGLGLLYWIRTVDKRGEDLARAESPVEPDGDGETPDEKQTEA